MPNQSAIRIIVPRFPGSLILSRIKLNSFCISSLLKLNSGCFAIANTLFGVVNELIFFKSASLISEISIFEGKLYLFLSNQSEVDKISVI